MLVLKALDPWEPLSPGDGSVGHPRYGRASMDKSPLPLLPGSLFSLCSLSSRQNDQRSAYGAPASGDTSTCRKICLPRPWLKNGEAFPLVAWEQREWP